MPRPKGSKNLTPGTVVEIPMGQPLPLQAMCNNLVKITTLDATIPTDNAMTNNQVRAAIRETRAKLNEIINILNAR